MKPDYALRALYYTGEHRKISVIHYTLQACAPRFVVTDERCRGAEDSQPNVASHLKFVDFGGPGYDMAVNKLGAGRTRMPLR